MKALPLVLVAHLGVSAALFGQNPDSVQVNQVYGLQRSELVELEIGGQMGEARVVEMSFDGRPDQMLLAPDSVRAPGFQLLAQVQGGSLVEVDPGPVSTFRGILAGQSGSEIVGGFQASGLYAKIILQDGRVRWIEPVGRQFPGAADTLHVMYDAEDLLVDSTALCGTVAHPTPSRSAGGSVNAPSAAASILSAEIAADGDFEYFQDWGSSVTNASNRIQSVIGAMNSQYESDVNLTHVVTTIIIRTSSDDPYTTASPSGLLNEFSSEWLLNQQSVQRDVAQLFTGRNLTGSTIGIANLSAICSVTGFSLVQSDFSGAFGCVTDLSAHELGHNWGAGHCSCPGGTMNASITCANSFTPFIAGEILSFASFASCLSSGPPCVQDVVENNDSCFQATSLGDGLLSNLVASEDDRDFYDFEIEPFGSLTVDLLFSHASGDLDALLREGCTGAMILDMGMSMTDNEQVSFVNTSNTTVTAILEVLMLTGSNCVDYALDVELLASDACLIPEDSFEPNDSCATAIPVGNLSLEPLLVSLASPDLYSVCVAAGDSLNVDAFFSQEVGNVDLFLFTAAGCGGTLLTSSTSSSSVESLQWTNTSSFNQSYVVEVRLAAGSAQDCSGYVLELSGAGASCTAPTPLGTNFCGPAVPNSTGSPGMISGVGSDVAVDNNLVLLATNLPSNQAGYYLASLSQGFVANAGGSQGNLCLGAPAARFISQIMTSGAEGTIAVQIDTSLIPSSPPQPILAGQTWNFQLWHRDSNPVSTSNFTDGLSILFQ